MITCVVCKTIKNDDDFNWKNKNKGVRKNYCRDCDKTIKRRYYKNHKEKVKQENSQRRIANMEKFQQWKNTLECSICRETESCCLDFHHVDPNQKEVEVSQMAQYRSWKALMEEVDKCIVVCRNCHAKIHAGILKADVA